MRKFGLCLLARGIRNVALAEMGAPFAHAMGVIQVAHGAEILIKARIADEHPLLIFEKLPKEASAAGSHLSIEDLFQGRSIQFFDLPDKLWATTGISIPDRQLFESFGKLRNKIQHLAVPAKDLPRPTLRFAFKIMEPLIELFWPEENVWNYMDPASADDGFYVLEALKRLGIRSSHVPAFYLGED